MAPLTVSLLLLASLSGYQCLPEDLVSSHRIVVSPALGEAMLFTDDHADGISFRLVRAGLRKIRPPQPYYEFLEVEHSGRELRIELVEKSEEGGEASATLNENFGQINQRDHAFSCILN